jgi:sialic acid synthase SpsE
MEIKIDQKIVGDNHPCFVIAEIGSNHNQDFDLAIELIDAAAESNVDAVKFQTFRASDHYSENTPGFSYLDNINTSEMIRSLELNRAWQADLKTHAEKKNLIFFSSPCDSDAIKGLSKLNVSIYKVASFDITDDGLISEIAREGKPVILSTGLANLNDIQFAVDTVRSQGNNDIILLQCTSLYPAPTHLSNLSAMQTMRLAFNTLVGYSDHTLGDHIPIAAVTLGACVIEKHFTLDRGLPGPDHAFAMEPLELKDMMCKLREVEVSLGDGSKNGPRSEEIEMAEKGRRSIHAKVNISKGEVITEDMLCVKRPGFGISPFFKKIIVGRKVKRNISVDEWITWDMI